MEVYLLQLAVAMSHMRQIEKYMYHKSWTVLLMMTEPTPTSDVTQGSDEILNALNAAIKPERKPQQP